MITAFAGLLIIDLIVDLIVDNPPMEAVIEYVFAQSATP